MTRITTFSLILISMLALQACSSNQDIKQPWPMGWRSTHWKNQDFKPYVRDYEHAHAPQMNDSEWMFPRDGRSTEEFVQGLEDAGLVGAPYFDKSRGVAVIDVGPNFYTMSWSDQQAMFKMLGQIYGIMSEQDGTLLLDYNTNRVVGEFTPAAGVLLY